MNWAWLVCLAFLPEMAAKAFARSPRFDASRHTLGAWPCSELMALSAVCSIDPQKVAAAAGLSRHAPSPLPLSAAFRFMCAAAAAVNIAALMAANLAGFVVGLDGLAGAAGSTPGLGAGRMRVQGWDLTAAHP